MYLRKRENCLIHKISSGANLGILEGGGGHTLTEGSLLAASQANRTYIDNC